jgi:phage-related protein (TIGR01555 family)
MKKSAPPPGNQPKAAMTGDSFQNFAARLGIDSGNLSAGATYNLRYLSRNRQLLDAMYRESWIVGKAVDLVAEDMTKRGVEINSSMNPAEIDELMRGWKSLKIWDALSSTIKWGRLYGGAIAVLLIDGQNTETPLRPETVQQGQFRGLLALDRWQVQPSLNKLVTELGPNLGMPQFYDVLGAARALGNKRIHYSRVIRIDGTELPYWQAQAENWWGQSVIERLYDRLLAFDSTTQGAAQLIYKAHLRTYKVEGLRDIIAAGGQVLAGLVKQINFIRLTQTNEGLSLMDAKDEFEAFSYSFAGLDTVLLQFSQQLSGAIGIPLTKLFAQSPAGMNATGESDLRNYYDSINQEQESKLRNGMGLIVRVSYRSQYGNEPPAGTDFTFRALWQLSDEQKATVAATLTTAITGAVTSGLVGQKTGLLELRQQSRLTGVWTNIPDAVIAAASDDVTPMGELGAPGGPGGAADMGDEADEDDKEDAISQREGK